MLSKYFRKRHFYYLYVLQSLYKEKSLLSTQTNYKKMNFEFELGKKFY